MDLADLNKLERSRQELIDLLETLVGLETVKQPAKVIPFPDRTPGHKESPGD
jgi:hypothetical protein